MEELAENEPLPVAQEGERTTTEGIEEEGYFDPFADELEVFAWPFSPFDQGLDLALDFVGIVSTQVSAALSALLSHVGSAAFLSHALDVAAAFGIHLEGVSWVLVQYWLGQRDNQPNIDVDILLDRAQTVACSGVNRAIIGHSIYSLGYRMVTDERKALMERVLHQGPGPCRLGTIHLNQSFGTRGGTLNSQTGYVFYNEVREVKCSCFHSNASNGSAGKLVSTSLSYLHRDCLLLVN